MESNTLQETKAATTMTSGTGRRRPLNDARLLRDPAAALFEPEMQVLQPMTEDMLLQQAHVLSQINAGAARAPGGVHAEADQFVAQC